MVVAATVAMKEEAETAEVVMEAVTRGWWRWRRWRGWR